MENAFEVVNNEGKLMVGSRRRRERGNKQPQGSLMEDQLASSKLAD
jgi:hypothetical protein